MDWREQIVLDPHILGGKPAIKGTRIAVEFIVELVAEGWGFDEILRNYPQLTRKDIPAALKYAAEVLKSERVYPLTAGRSGEGSGR